MTTHRPNDDWDNPRHRHDKKTSLGKRRTAPRPDMDETKNETTRPATRHAQQDEKRKTEGDERQFPATGARRKTKLQTNGAKTETKTIG